MFEGKDVPPATKDEDIFKVMEDIIGRKFNVTLQKNEVAQIHRISGGSKVIIEFVLRGPNSNFQKILIPNEKELTDVNVKASLKVTRSVKRSMFLSSFLKKHDDIVDYKVNLF